jgi:hypothetical protein
MVVPGRVVVKALKYPSGEDVREGDHVNLGQDDSGIRFACLV